MAFMLNIPGYELQELLYEGENTVVYRAHAENTGHSVILKALKAEYPTLEQISRLNHEYQVTANLDLANVARVYEFYSYQNRLVLVYEDFGGRSLKKYLATQSLSLTNFLNIALQLATALDSLHENQIIHKDIKPSNIIINPETLQVKLTDFSIAYRQLLETNPLDSFTQLEGTLAYMSPEQTGRINHTLDYRSDFYSLGVTFYEILTGRLPFESDDPLELIHCHLAKEPIAACEINPQIPTAIAAIVSKLMAKNPENRYQCAIGLKADLEFCLEQMQTTGAIPEFTPGNLDAIAQFAIPTQLYGRKKAIEQLLEISTRVSQGSCEVVLITGSTGVGKSMFMQHMIHLFTDAGWLWTSGKFDQSQQDISLSCVIKSFRGLVQRLLTGTKEEIGYWRDRFLDALGDNARLMVQIIPELQIILGKQLPELTESATENQIFHVFYKFLFALQSQQHPLVNFMDDIQWADAQTLGGLQMLVADSQNQYQLAIYGYREQDVTPQHPLMQAVNQMRKKGIKVTQITLEPLTLADTIQFVGDTFKVTGDRVNSLAELLFAKTQGNVFFLTQLLTSLYEDKLVWFDFPSRQWQWNLESIQQKSMTDNVVDLMINKIAKLPQATQKLLSLAACIGTKFNLDILATINQSSLTQTSIQLWYALQAGLIRAANNSELLSQLISKEELPDINYHIRQINYEFGHQRIQQAAYEMISDRERQMCHLEIGRLLLKKTSDLTKNVSIIPIVNQLNLAYIEDISEREELVKLNLLVAVNFQSSREYITARKYLEQAKTIIPENSWQSNYDLTLSLHQQSAELGYLCGDYEQVHQEYQIILANCRTPLDCVAVQEIQIRAYITERKLVAAIAIAKAALQEFHVNLPNHPSGEEIYQACQNSIELLSNYSITDIVNFPENSHREELAVMKIILTVIPAIYRVEPSISPLLLISQINNTLKYGNSELSSFLYANYAVIIINYVKDFAIAEKYIQVAMQLLSKYPSPEMRAKVNYILGTRIIHHQNHITNTLSILEDSYKLSLKSGNIDYLGYSINQICQNEYFLGKNLYSISQTIQSYIHSLYQYQTKNILQICEDIYQITINLSGIAENEHPLFEQNSHELSLIESQDNLGLHYFYIHKLIYTYLLDDVCLLPDIAAQARKYLEAGQGMITVPVFYFYDSLATLAISNQTGDKDKILQQVKDNQEQLKSWAESAPMNYQHKYNLVVAEIHRVNDEYLQAMDCYDSAIAEAEKHGYVQESALANELAGKFYLSLGKTKIAQIYLSTAYHYYLRWGAITKVEKLEAEYPELLLNLDSQSSGINPASLSTTLTTSSTRMTTSAINHHKALDLATVMKAAQAINSEIVLDNLLDKLLDIILENAAAQKGCLILEKSGQLIITAIDTNQNASEIKLQSVPVRESADVPISLIDYVARTHQPLVIADACSDSLAQGDRYIQQHQPQSLLCSPIFYQGKFIGIVYLENNLVTAAFTPKHLEMLQLLTAQAAIAIENAKLYEQSKSYARLLENSLQDIQQTLKEREIAEKEKAKLLAILDATLDFVGIGSATGENIYINPAGRRMLGISQEDDIRETNFSQFVPQSETEYLFTQAIPTAIETGSWVGESVLLSQDGQQIPISQVIIAHKSPTGDLEYLSTISRDITQQKQIENALRDSEIQLRQKAEELENTLTELKRAQLQMVQNEKMSTLGNLVAGVAHEVNNPIGFLNGSIKNAEEYVRDLLRHLQLYQENYPNPVAEIQEDAENIDIEFITEDLQKLLQSMKGATDRIKGISTSLRTFSRADTENKIASNIHEGIDSTLLILKYRLKANELRPNIEVFKEYSDLPMVECYPGQLNQVFMNLLANAIDAIDDAYQEMTLAQMNENPKYITIRTELVGKQVINIRIRDNGPGMSEETKCRIFDHLFTTKGVGKGTGLGLSIARQIIEETHGGTLICQSNLGEGTEFVIQIPIKSMV